MEHQPGILTRDQYGQIKTESGKTLCISNVSIPAGGFNEEAETNGRRLFALWNACEGIPTEALEGGIVKELLGALEQAVNALADTRDFVASIIDDKSVKWNLYIELTEAMKIPQINQLIAKAKP